MYMIHVHEVYVYKKMFYRTEFTISMSCALTFHMGLAFMVSGSPNEYYLMF